MQLMKYHLRARHKKEGVFWEATVLAPGVFVAALWFKRHTRCPGFPTVLRKNNQPYRARTGSRAYMRAAKIASKKKRLSPAQKAHLKKKDEAETVRAEKMFHLCSLLEEDPYVVD